jgi:hypothetical protein
MEERVESRLKPKLAVLLELAWILVWTLWLGSAYLDLDRRVWPMGREFGMAIHPNFIWTHLTTCGDCVLWNGYFNGGAPTFGELHASVAHPLTVIGTVLFGGVNGAKIVLLSSLVMAGFAQWWLARVIGLGWLARVWSASVVVAAGHLAGRMEHGVVGLVVSTAACSLVLAPALKVALDGRRRDTIVLAVVLALAIVAGQGYMQIALFLGIFPLLVLFLFKREGKIRPQWKELVLALVLSMLLAGVFLVPLAHFWPQFGKAIDPTFGSSQPLSYMPFNFLIREISFYQGTLLGKQPYGYMYMNYVGWIPILLAVVAMRLVPKDNRRILLYLCLAIGMTLFLGSGIPFKWLFKVMPEQAAAVRSSPVMAGLAVPFLVALAAWGLDLLLKLNWPTLSLETASDSFRPRFNTKYLFLPILVLGSLLSVYEFSKGWLETFEMSGEAYEVVNAVRTESAQWVAMPFGEHYWSPVASEAGVKLTQLVRPSDWRGREVPEPFISASRHPESSGTAVFAQHGVYVSRDVSNQYAYVQAGAEIWPCEAKARGGHIDVHCSGGKAGTLIVRENAWSGWSARRDGERVALQREGDWLATNAPAGEHTYQFRYRPWDVALGSLLTLVGALVAVVLWRPGFVGKARAQIRSRRPASEDPGERDGGSPEPEETDASGVEQAREV